MPVIPAPGRLSWGQRHEVEVNLAYIMSTDQPDWTPSPHLREHEREKRGGREETGLGMLF